VSARQFRPYPDYKDSGVDWLGQIPAHWRPVRTKFVARVNPSRASLPKVRNDLPVSFHAMEAVGNGELLEGLERPISEMGSGYTPFMDDDVLIAKITPSFENGKGALAQGLLNGIGFGTTELHVIRPGPGTDPRYTFFVSLSHSFRHPGTGMMQGTAGQQRVPDDFVINFAFPLPPLPEQRAIAAFLDRETSKIDALVAKKERLIELLQEKRTSLISHAVTKGLDPNFGAAKVGSASFSEMPDHWESRKLRRLIRRVIRPLVIEPNTEYREIGIRSWGKGIFHKDPVRGALLEDKSVYYIEPGDFVLNIVFAWEGAVAVVSEREVGMVASHRFPTFRHSGEVDLDYLLMVLQSEQGRALMAINSPGAAGRNRTIRLAQFFDEEIPLPPLTDQHEIVRKFRHEERRNDALLAKVREAIERLKEYRTALISAAVTGKIDVRGEAQ